MTRKMSTRPGVQHLTFSCSLMSQLSIVPIEPRHFYKLKLLSSHLQSPQPIDDYA